MLAVADAQARVLEGVRPLPPEWLPIDQTGGRVLAADLAAAVTKPDRDASAMDGYAVRAADTTDAGRWLEVVGENRAGATGVPHLDPGQAARLFTGAGLPAGADAVALQENAERQGDRVRFSRAALPGEFVRPAGLDFRLGWVGLRAGSVLDPLRLGLAAAMGHGWLGVRRRPRVGILSTGDELARPGEAAGPERTTSSNALVLAGLVRAWGGQPVDLGLCADTPAALAAGLGTAAGLDLLVTTGGASVGAYDLVAGSLANGGADLAFVKIAMRPGKPMLFGRVGPMPVLGLPGNPVSATVCAILFLRGVLHAQLGLGSALPTQAARCTQALPANDEREDYVRAALLEGPDGPETTPLGRQDSSMVATLARADALLVRPPHATATAAGASVVVVPLHRALGLSRATLDGDWN